MSLKAPKKTELQLLVPRMKLGKPLGAGGNAIVYAAKCDKVPVAIKFLLNPDAKRYGRFRDEVLVVTTLKGSTRVVPILDHYLPESRGAETPWYVMPIATPLRTHLKGALKRDVVDAVAELADGLSELHEKKVAHRDIKPENLFVFESTFRYGDFGIAKFPESSGLTTSTEPMGPLGYMADEMMRDSTTADPFKADVLSLAKTLWVLLTNQPFPFLGQYLRRGRYSLDNLLASDGFVHEPLDDLLEACTHSDPDKRPSARELAQALREALNAQEEFALRNPLQWAGAEALALGVPCARLEWTDPNAITEVVSLLCRRDSLNHCFFPRGGGLDIIKAELTEGGTAILLWHGERMATVVKPIRLTLERIRGGPQGSYATLESAPLEPLGVREKGKWDEKLWRCDEYDYIALPEDDDPRPDNVTLVSRYIKPGMFIIAPKGGIYNRVDSYQGKGNALGRDKLRTLFERHINDKHPDRRGFSLQRCVRLVGDVSRRTPSASAPFLSKLDLTQFEQLLALDDGMKTLRSRCRDDGIKNILSPDPAWLAKDDEILQFLRGLSAEQYREAMTLMYFGRGELKDDADLLKISEWTAKDPRDEQYLAEKFGNGYFLSAAKRFGLRVVSKGAT